MDTKFKANLKAIRKERNLTQWQVAERLGVVESCYANWEQGRTEPDISTLRKLSLIFGVSIDYLLGLEDDFGTRVEIKENFSLSAQEKELLTFYRQLSPYLQGLTLDTVRGWAGSSGESKSNLQKKA